MSDELIVQYKKIVNKDKKNFRVRPIINIHIIGYNEYSCFLLFLLHG